MWQQKPQLEEAHLVIGVPHLFVLCQWVIQLAAVSSTGKGVGRE